MYSVENIIIADLNATCGAGNSVWSLQSLQSRMVVWLIGDLGHQFGVQNFVVLVEHHDRASREAIERTVCDVDAVSGVKFPGTESRQGDDVVEAFGAAGARWR